MLPGKSVTERDVEATEKRLAESYSRLKEAITSMPSDAVRPVADAVKSHPYASIAAAAGAGYMSFRLLDTLLPRTKAITREVEAGVKPKRSLLSRLLSDAVKAVIPYITVYAQKEVSRMLAKREKEE